MLKIEFEMNTTEQVKLPKTGYLDGIRGLAALYVAIHHAAFEVFDTAERDTLSPWLKSLRDYFTYERHAVDAFIALSGYCLMSSVLRTAESGDRKSLRLPGGIGGFLSRRFKRIYPPYVASLALALLLTFLVPKMSEPQGMRWDHSLPAFSWDIIGSHLLLIHNWRNEWIYKISYPLWSIGTEWQIYFLFPVFVFLFKRAGALLAFAFITMMGMLPYFYLGFFPQGASSWFTCLFGMGALTAALTDSAFFARLSLRNRFWKIALAGLAVAYGAGRFLSAHFHFTDRPWLDQMAQDVAKGLMFCALFAVCAFVPRRGIEFRKNALAQLLGSKPLLKLGSFSYSLYLIHAPILFALHLGLKALGLSSDVKALTLLTVGIGLSMFCAQIFSTVFERGFSLKKIFRKATMPASA